MITDNLTPYRGDAFSRTYRFLVGTDPRDLSGYTLEAQIREQADSEAVTASFTVDAADAAMGEVTISLPPATTAALPQFGVWDLQATAIGNPDDVETLVGGGMQVTADVTR